MKVKESISLILPVYNEEALLEKTIRTSIEKLSKFTDNFEIVIIDDASEDRSVKIAERLSREFSQVVMLQNLVNLGAGTSILRGMKIAKGDFILHNGADYPFDIDDLKETFPILQNADIVVVIRKDRSAYSLWRKITSLANKFLIHLLFRPRISDMNFIQIYKRDVLQDPDVINIFSRSPAFVTPELLIRAKMKGYRIVQFKTDFHRRKSGKVKIGKPHDIIWSLYDMLRFRIKLCNLKLQKSL